MIGLLTVWLRVLSGSKRNASLIMSKKHHQEFSASIIRYKPGYAPLCKCRKVSVLHYGNVSVITR